MKAISLWQPWASLCVIGAKQYETRDWATSYRGRILIHASKNKEEIDLVRCSPFSDALLTAGIYDDLPLGAILGAVTIEEMIRTEVLEPKILETMEHEFGNYAAGRWAWKLSNPAWLQEPVPCRGRQKIFNVPADVAAAVTNMAARGMKGIANHGS